MKRGLIRGGLPIAAHVALLVALALIATFVVNILVVVALPPRPPGVAPFKSVMETVKTGYEAARAGRPLPRVALGEFRVVGQAPRVGLSPPFAAYYTAALAKELGRAPTEVVISFERPPADVIIYREVRALGGPPPHRLPPQGPPPHPPHARPLIIDGAPAPPPPPRPPDPPRFESAGGGAMFLARFVIGVQMPDGRWLVLRQRRSIEDVNWLFGAALGIGGAFAIALALGLVFAARLAAPIRRFADAAHRVGVDPRGDPIPEDGPRELQVAAQAVNAMQTRLRGLVADRTQMLAAVAHDLRTPLMRMRLAAEQADPAIRDAIGKDATEIDALVASFIAFARDDPSLEARVKLDVAALAQSIVDDRAAAGDDARYEGPDRAVLTGQPLGLKRMLVNLVDNAIRYGGSAEVALRNEGARIIIEVRDRGPGVPEERRVDVFEPFVRLDPEAAAGAGLGLAVVRSVVRAHGGDVVIDDAPGGGARIRVQLPT